MLQGKQDSQGKLPVADLSRRMGFQVDNPALFGKDFNNGYAQGQSPSLQLRSQGGVQAEIDALRPMMSTKLPYYTEALKEMYSQDLASAMDDGKSLYNPIPNNYFQRLAYIMKTRLREKSLYNSN